jgi:hypothetical protein
VGKMACATRGNACAPAWSPHTDRARDSVVARLPAARCCRRPRGGHRGDARQGGAEAHRSGVPMVRRRKRRQAAAFNDGGVALVVIDERGGGGGVLQLEGDPGVRRRRSIEEWSSSEGALTGGGGRR